MSFVRNLRMQTLFPSSGGISPAPRPYEDRFEEEPNRIESDGLTTEERLALIQLTKQARGIQDKPQPMNVVFKDLSPFQRESLALRDRSLDLSEQRASNTFSLGRERNAIQSDRTRIMDFKAKNPNSRIVVGRDGITRAINPQTNEMTELGRTGLSQEELAELNQENSIERLELTNEARAALAAVNHLNRLEQIGAQGEQQRQTNLERPVKSNEESPTELKTRRWNAAKELIDTNPELGQFITLGPSGTFAISKSTKAGFIRGAQGPTAEQRQKINDFIYKKSTEKLPEAPPAPKGKTEPDETPAQSTADSDKRNQAIEILKANGKPVTENNIKYVMGQIK